MMMHQSLSPSLKPRKLSPVERKVCARAKWEDLEAGRLNPKLLEVPTINKLARELYRGCPIC